MTMRPSIRNLFTRPVTRRIRKAPHRARLAMEALEDRCLMSSGDTPVGDTLVNVGSPTTPFPQNKQNEPALAVDPVHPNVLVAGANDEIDLEPGPAGDPTTAPFTPGVGVSGIYFSLNGGASWIQPTYTGWTARGGTPEVGSIGTLPGYYENGLVSDGDPAIAIGPKPGPGGTFSWSNGSRLYYANLTSNFSSVRSEQAFKGSEAIAVSRTDNLAGAVAGDNSAWMSPVIVSRQSSALFSDKDAIWVDNAATSPYFGNVYVANVAFRSNGHGGAPEPVMSTRSVDGGNTWSGQQQLSPATNNAQTGGRQGAVIRTDSHGTIYVFWIGNDITTRQDVMYMDRSFDGGLTFERPSVVAVVHPVGIFDAVQGDFTFDGVAGARTDSFPSVDIANGAPTGADATDEIVMTWADGQTPSDTAPGPNEHALVQYSTNGGNSWSTPVNVAPPSDRPDFPAIAISPDGHDVYVTYDNFLQPWQSNTNGPRLMQGVVRHADIAPGGSPGTWSDLHRGPTGDARGSSANSLVAEFLGDYNSIVATRTYGAAVWNDVRNAADSPEIDAYRQSLVAGSPGSPPNLGAIASMFGNSDIYFGMFADPTPNSPPASTIANALSPASTSIDPVFLVIPDVTSADQLLTTKARKRTTSPPAVVVP
jgi:hypothetical protein